MPSGSVNPGRLGAAANVAAPSTGPWGILRLVSKKMGPMPVVTWDRQAATVARAFDSGVKVQSARMRATWKKRRGYDIVVA
jgi:hypothetical protein